MFLQRLNDRLACERGPANDITLAFLFRVPTRVHRRSDPATPDDATTRFLWPSFDVRASNGDEVKCCTSSI